MLAVHLLLGSNFHLFYMEHTIKHAGMHISRFLAFYVIAIYGLCWCALSYWFIVIRDWIFLPIFEKYHIFFICLLNAGRELLLLEVGQLAWQLLIN